MHIHIPINGDWGITGGTDPQALGPNQVLFPCMGGGVFFFFWDSLSSPRTTELAPRIISFICICIRSSSNKKKSLNRSSLMIRPTFSLFFSFSGFVFGLKEGYEKKRNPGFLYILFFFLFFLGGEGVGGLKYL